MDYRIISGQRIAAARKALGLTQTQLAEKLPGVSQSRLGNYEQGTRYPDPPLFDALSTVLNEPASYLAAFKDEPDFTALTRKYKKLDQRGKDTLHRVAESESAPYTPKPIDEEKTAS